MHELPHNHSRNPRHAHPLPLPCVGPNRNTCNNSRPFSDILSTTEVFSSWFFSCILLDQILLLPIYNTPKSKSNHIFLVLFCVGHLTSFLSYHNPLAFTSLASYHLFASPKSPYQSPSKILIHRSIETFSLGYRNCIPSQ
jgi:hypothetical protein